MIISREKDHAIAEMIANEGVSGEMKYLQKQMAVTMDAVNNAVEGAKAIKPDAEALANIRKEVEQARHLSTEARATVKEVETRVAAVNQINC